MRKQKRYDKDFELPNPGMKSLRGMQAGEVRVFASGTRKPSGMFCGASNACRTASTMGMTITQRTMCLVDTVTYRSVPVILIECITPAPGKQKRGRKPHVNT